MSDPCGRPQTRDHARRIALRDAVTDVCADCAGRAFPDGKMPLSGPNEAGNYVHTRNEQVTLCAASGIWSRIAWEWDLAEVARLSPRGWEKR